ncbi:unnamed protein product [Phytophthora lilii]|uniref:glucan endo-1,3-beta-D-glucosidase n=1 Tax=Phytophthora lilii TaxID=2077276 RepID=A0A9W6TE83_9STRA|nr:unnamed protein product [Phytophthora lilii]
MVCATYKTVFAMMAAIAMSSVEAGAGVCYAPWHHPTVTEDVIQADIKQIGQYFNSFRTFETRMSNLNAIDMAAKAGVKIAAGVQMNDPAGVDAEIQAVCDGYNKNPGSVEVIWVGNENLQNDGFGTYSAEQLVGYIQKVKSCTNNGVPVGTVQRINEWLDADGAATVAGACDKIGVNIYPFFSQGEGTPIQKLEAQWQQIIAKYDAGKIQVGETGWPTAGEQYQGNTPSLETMEQYLNDFVMWSADKVQAYWFMMYDTTTSYTGAEYEKHFGVCGSDGKPKFSIPGGMTTPSTSTGSQTQGSQTQGATEAPATPATVAPSTPATEAPAGTPAPADGGDQTQQQGEVTPAPTPAPTTANNTQVNVPETPATESPAQETPSQETPAQETLSQETPSQETPAQDTPSVTPAPTTPTVVQSGKDCAM